VIGRDTIVTIPAFSVLNQQANVPTSVAAFLESHDPVVTSVGLFTPLYGFRDIVQALAIVRSRHPRAGLLLVGDTADASPIRQQVADARLDDDVLIAGNLDHDVCLEVVRRSAIFVRATQSDGDSNSVREALALGVPVVATSTDFRPSGTVLYASGDVTALAARLLDHCDFGRSSARVCTDHTEHLEQLRQVYREVLCPS
jgi:glycosyltransferase involved in cell wall biosynthesis